MRSGVYDVPPAASLAAVQRGQDGRMVVFDDDVCNVVKDLQEIDPRFRVRYMERGECWVISQLWEEDGYTRETFCFSVRDRALDQRVVTEARRITSESYDLADELENEAQRRKAAQREQMARRIEDGAAQAVHAMRREVQAKDRIYVP